MLCRTGTSPPKPVQPPPPWEVSNVVRSSTGHHSESFLVYSFVPRTSYLPKVHCLLANLAAYL